MKETGTPALKINVVPTDSRNITKALHGIQSDQNHSAPLAMRILQNKLKLLHGERATNVFVFSLIRLHTHAQYEVPYADLFPSCLVAVAFRFHP